MHGVKDTFLNRASYDIMYLLYLLAMTSVLKAHGTGAHQVFVVKALRGDFVFFAQYQRTAAAQQVLVVKIEGLSFRLVSCMS